MMAPTPNPTPTANAGIAALAPKATPQQVPQQAGGGSGDLMQVQAQLRDLPAGDPRTMQILTSYANGANPMVPQFLALGEIKRREQMMQQPAQPPQGTVKDKVEQSANTMAMQQAKQQQAMQAMAAQASQMPGPVPQGTPQPAVNMAEGGVVALPVSNEMFNYAGGGIVAFAEPDGKQVTGDPSKQETSDADKIKGIKYDTERHLPSRAHSNKPAAGDETMQSIIDAVGGFLSNLTNPDAELARNRGLNVAPAAAKEATETQTASGPNYDATTQAQGAAELARLRDGAGAQQPGIASLAPRPPASPASGGTQTKPAASGDQAMQVLMNMMSGKGGVEMPMSPEARRAQMMQSNPEIAAALSAPQGQDMAKVLDAIGARDQAAREAFKKREGSNQLDALSAALIAAGKGTAGKRGGLGQLAGALGGAGESLIGANAAANERAIKQEALERDQDLTMGKLREEIAGKRRAAAEGRVGDMAKHDLKIAELKQLLEDNQRDAAKSVVADERTRSEGALNRAAQLEASRISSGSRGDPNVQNAIRAIKDDEMINQWHKDIEALNKLPSEKNLAKAKEKERQIASRQNEIYKHFKVDMPPITIDPTATPSAPAGGSAPSGWGKAQVVKP